MAVRHLYLHGFASGPSSKKGLAFAAHLAARGIELERLDLRVPSFAHLRLSAMIEVTRAAIGGPDDRAIVYGSSLGGLTAARVAERDDRVTSLVLLAPAFQILPRWRQLPGWDDWERTGWREVTDYTTGQPAHVDFEFTRDLDAIDLGSPDVRVPTVIFHGRHDEVVPISHSRQFAATRPHVRLVELDDGHELLASLDQMLAQLPAPAG